MAVFVGLVTPGVAQTSAGGLTTWGVADGMRHSTARAVLADTDGFVWVGTADGLHRIDPSGVTVLAAGPADNRGWHDDDITSIHQGPEGHLWVGTFGGGLHYVDTRLLSVRQIPVDVAGEPVVVVRDVTTVGAGIVLLASDRGAVAIESTRTTEGGDPLWSLREDVEATALSDATGGQVWVGYEDGVLQRVDRSGTSPSLWAVSETIELGFEISAIVRARDAGLWVGTRGGGLYLLDQDSLRIRDRLWAGSPTALLHDRVQDVMLGSDDRVWVATLEGLMVLAPNPSENASIRLTRENGLPHARTLSLAQSGEGVWLGTWDGVVLVHRRREAIRAVTDLVGVDRAAWLGQGIVSLAGAGGNQLWLGTWGGGVHKVRLESSAGGIRAVPALSTLPGAGVFGLHVGDGNSVWAATLDRGLARVAEDGRSNVIYAERAVGLDSDTASFLSVLVDSTGDLWAGTQFQGLQRLEGSDGHLTRHASSDPVGVDGNYVRPMVEDSARNLWVGLFEEGLLRLGPDRDEPTLFRPWGQGPSENRFLSLRSVEGTLWVATEGKGLYALDPETGEFRAYTAADGLPHNNVQSVLGDESGFLWVATNEGLARFDPATEEFWVFKEAAGLPGSRFFANAAYRNRETGELYFGGPDGLVVVDPSAIQRSQTPPRVALTGLRINGDTVPVARAMADGGLHLEPDENFFTLEFAVLDFTDVSQNGYQYMLDPLQTRWEENGSDNIANYTSVPPGDYTFRVRARNGDGVEGALALPVFVATPWWQTWRFRSAVLAAMALLISALFTNRLRQIRRLQDQRLGFAARLHDDIGANVSAMALKADVASQSGGEVRAKHLADISRLARDTAHKVRETVWVVSTRYDTVAGVVSKMRDELDLMLDGQVRIDFIAPEDLPAKPVGMMLRQDIYLLYKEALQNIVKHAMASSVKVEVRYDAPTLTLIVRDDGEGFDPDGREVGNGLASMKARAAKHGGALRWDSAPGEGTMVELKVKMK